MSAPTSDAEEENLREESLISHLVDLRQSIMRSLLALLIVLIALLPFADRLFSWLAMPLLEELTGSSELIAVGVLSPFIIQITTSFFFALWITLPYLLYNLWRFIAPGLYQNERQLLLPLIVSSTLLFSAGMVFCYFFVFQLLFGFIAKVTPAAVTWTPDISDYFSVIVKMSIGFGLAFETPVAVFILVRSGVVALDTMKKARPYVIVGAFVVAAVITPPDIISQILLAIPCWLLYEVGLLFAPKRVKARASQTASSTPP